MGWATCWANFLQTHPVTLVGTENGKSQTPAGPLKMVSQSMNFAELKR
jgi:hypothetical protein